MVESDVTLCRIRNNLADKLLLHESNGFVVCSVAPCVQRSFVGLCLNVADKLLRYIYPFAPPELASNAGCSVLTHLVRNHSDTRKLSIGLSALHLHSDTRNKKRAPRTLRARYYINHSLERLRRFLPNNLRSQFEPIRPRLSGTHAKADRYIGANSHTEFDPCLRPVK